MRHSSEAFELECWWFHDQKHTHSQKRPQSISKSIVRTAQQEIDRSIDGCFRMHDQAHEKATMIAQKRATDRGARRVCVFIGLESTFIHPSNAKVYDLENENRHTIMVSGMVGHKRGDQQKNQTHIAIMVSKQIISIISVWLEVANPLVDQEGS